MAGRFRHFSGFLGLLLAGIALVSQLALGAMVLPDDSPQGALSALDAASILCGGNHPSDHGGPASQSHRPANPALCPISVALALPAVVLTSTPAFPVSSDSILYFRTKERPPGRGPPAATARVGAPRAPPLTA